MGRHWRRKDDMKFLEDQSNNTLLIWAGLLTFGAGALMRILSTFPGYEGAIPWSTSMMLVGSVVALLSAAFRALRP